MGARFSAPVQTGPGAHLASCTGGTGSFTGVKSGRGVTLTPHSHLVPWSRKSRTIPLLPLWAVRPVQSLSACTRVHFTVTLQTLIKSVSLTVQPEQDSKTQQPQKSSCITMKCIQHISQYRQLTESAYEG